MSSKSLLINGTIMADVLERGTTPVWREEGRQLQRLNNRTLQSGASSAPERSDRRINLERLNFATGTEERRSAR